MPQEMDNYEGPHHVEVYKDKAGEFRWRARGKGGRIIADSGEGYTSKESALHGIDLNYGDDVPVVDQTDAD